MKRIIVFAIAIGTVLAFRNTALADSAQFGDCTVHMRSLDANNQTANFTVPAPLTLTCPGRTVNADRAEGNFKRKNTTLFGHVVVHDDRGAGSLANFGTSPQGAQGPATLSTDRLNVDAVSKIYTATGNVHYVQGNRIIDAERGILDDNSKNMTLYTVHFVQGTQTVTASKGFLNDRTHNMDLTGAVRIVDGDRKMDADHVIYNTQTGDLHAQGNVTMRFPGGGGSPQSAPASAKKKKRLLPF